MSNELADAARGCPALRHVAELVDWVGPSRPVTANGVLRRADVAHACRVLGVVAPQRLRSAGDLPALHYPWVAAVSVGALHVEGGRVRPGTEWASTGDDAVLDGWVQGLSAALASHYVDGDPGDALEIGRLTLAVLATDPAPTDVNSIGIAVMESLYASDLTLLRNFGRGHLDPAQVVLELLAAFGAAGSAGAHWRITPLGRWAGPELGRRQASALEPSVAEGICQVKVALRHFRPACWRRLLVPSDASLGELHEVLQVAFRWDGDHLHAFTVGQRRYGDPYFDFEHDEYEITVSEAFARTGKPLRYVYDLGDNWEHEIVLEQTIEPDPDGTYPSCVDGRGDAPVEDCPDEELGWITFDRADINARLARLGSAEPGDSSDLQDVIDIILTDAYGPAEQLSAFLTVLQEEIDFPVPATLLDAPVSVVGLDEDDTTQTLQARCAGARQPVSFADLEFQPGTVAAWLQAAYLGHLGRKPATAPTPPAEWPGLWHWTR